MKVLFVGDTHANSHFIKQVYAHAQAEGVEAIVQAGDFGWWPRNHDGERFINTVSRLASTSGIPLAFVDGNHEDHHQLPHKSDEAVELEPGLWYWPRGTVHTLGDMRVLAFGGAVSVDRQWRTEHVDWFREEVANFDEFHRGLTAEGPIDVIVAHDVPTGVELSLTYPVTPDIEAHCVSHRDGMLELMEVHDPVLWVGGHYHQRRTQVLADTTVEALAHDGHAFIEDTYLEMDLVVA